MNRRTFISHLGTAIVGLSLSSPLELFASPITPERLQFFHMHTREHLEICVQGGMCTPSDGHKLNSFLRDFRTGEVHPIDLRLITMLVDIKNATGSDGVFEIFSGYRSPRTNTKLRTKSNGVARKSLHLEGRALDIRISDVPLYRLRNAAVALHQGGVGYYPKSDFVHIDTGDIRQW